MLEQAGVKGLRRGNTVVSSKHANFIYNTGGAHSNEILELAMEMRERVWDSFGVWLEFEMELLGNLAEDLQERLYEKRQAAFKHEKLAQVRSQFQTRLKEKY